MIRVEYACVIPATLHLKEILVGNSSFERFWFSFVRVTLRVRKMSDVRLSNASPTVERVDARQQDNVRQVRRSLFGRPNPEETRRDADAMTQDSVQDFMDRYNFDPVNERPLSPGTYEWQVDENAPEFYSRPPHGNQQPRTEAGSPDGNSRQDGEERTRTQQGRIASTNGSRKRRSGLSGSCATECPSKRSRSDNNDDDDDDEDSSDGAGSQAIPAVSERPSGSESRVEVS